VVKVVVLGSTGMLGNAVSKHFFEKENYETYTSYRSDELRWNERSFFFDALSPNFAAIPECDYIVNCIGIIKPFMSEDLTASIVINSLFPRVLSSWGQHMDAKVIHITTDCVFSGREGCYNEKSLHDCADAYGKTKSLGEPTDCMVLRTSIIGEEIHKKASLIEWAKSMKGKKIQGFTNHLWNGMTTTQYAEVCSQIIDKNLYTQGLFHLFSDTVNKYELVSYISESLQLDLQIESHETTTACDRTLSTNDDSLMKQLDIRSLHEQINLLRK